MERCIINGGALIHASLADCRFEHLTIRGGFCMVTGHDFLRVVFAGPIDATLIFGDPAPQMLERSGKDDWAIDISNAKFRYVELRDIPARLVRRDPATQFVVRRERALDGRWRKLEIEQFRISLGDLVKSDQDEVILVAGPRHKDFAKDLAALELLRREGIADPA